MKDAGEAVTKEEVKEMHAQADTNQDGKISFEEFVAMMKRNAEH